MDDSGIDGGMNVLKVLSVLLCISLTSCAVTQMSDEQIQTMSDDKLCSAVAANPTDFRLFTYMNGRKLTCHPAQITCKNSGFKIGSKDYAQCIDGMMAQIIKEKQDADARRMAFGAALGQWGQNMQAQSMVNRPVTTNCNTIGGSVSCTSY